MSHCTSFAFSYKDEALAVKSFRRMGLSPSTEVIAEYGNDFAKSFLSKIGYAGRRQMRAIVAASQGYGYFLCKEGPEYKLRLEKSGTITEADQANMTRMELEFRLTYIRIALENIAEKLENGGTPTRFVQENDTVILQFGPNFDRSIRVAALPGDLVHEEVVGVIGPACADLTSELEELLSLETAELVTEWKPEYRQEIEDQVVQVLKLHR